MMELQRGMERMMVGQFDKGREQYEMEMARMQEMGWMQAQQEMAAREIAMGQQFEQARMMEEANRWQNEMAMNKQHEEISISKEDEQRSIMNSTNQMLDLMLNDTDPRFQNSQFLQFLKQIRNKEIVIEGKEIRETGSKEAAMERAWGEG
jgi:peroxin-5